MCTDSEQMELLTDKQTKHVKKKKKGAAVSGIDFSTAEKRTVLLGFLKKTKLMNFK